MSGSDESGFADRANVPSENDVLTQLQRLLRGLDRARSAKCDAARLSGEVKERLLRALKAAIPLEEAVLHAGISEEAYLEAAYADPRLETEVLAAQKYPIMLARAVIRREMAADWRLADRFLQDRAVNDELDELRALTTDPIAA